MYINGLNRVKKWVVDVNYTASNMTVTIGQRQGYCFKVGMVIFLISVSIGQQFIKKDLLLRLVKEIFIQ